MPKKKYYQEPVDASKMRARDCYAPISRGGLMPRTPAISHNGWPEVEVDEVDPRDIGLELDAGDKQT